MEGQDAVELWGAYGSWSGKNAEDFQDGYALGSSYVADLGLPLDVGIETLFARFDADQMTDVVSEFQAAVVLRRWLLGQEAAIRPYLGSRLGYTRLSADFEDLQFEQNGVMGSLVLGVVFPTGRRLSPFVSVEAAEHRYEDTSIFLEGLEIPQSGGRGWRFFFKAGVTFGSGWERRNRY
jgi:hypothetical protein